MEAGDGKTGFCGQCVERQAEVERLREALSRIAGTRNTITGTRAWYRCKEIARKALAG